MYQHVQFRFDNMNFTLVDCIDGVLIHVYTNHTQLA